MKFIHQTEDGTKIEYELTGWMPLDEVLQEFQNFLRACGYVIDYNTVLDIVEMEGQQ
jgi:hypothetical protein